MVLCWHRRKEAVVVTAVVALPCVTSVVVTSSTTALLTFKRNKDGIPATVERLEYDPNRSAHIALLCYADGERRYIIAPKGVSAGDTVQSGEDSPIKVGNTLPLLKIPVGSTVTVLR